MEDLAILASSSFLKQYMITLFDRKFVGVFIKSFNDGKDKLIDLLFDQAIYHVDVISFTKGLFMVRHYCYVCQEGCSNIKHLCTGSCCLLCRQPKCKNRIGYITSSEQPGRRTGFKCDTCGLVLRSQDCLDNHIETRLCSLYFKCSSCSGTIPRHSIANHRCSKKWCSICSQYFDHSSQELHECFVQRPKITVKCASDTSVPGGSTQIFNDREEEPIVDDACIWFFDIETEQSCNNRNEHVPVLLVMQNVEKLEHVFFGYDRVADFCASVVEDEARVREQEWIIAHFGSGFDFLLIFQWLYKQQRFVPKILLRRNKVISMREGNKRFVNPYLFIPIPLSNFTKTFGLKELRKGFFPHYLTSPEALAEPAIALHSPCDCKATNGCHLQYQFSQDCYHCTEERRKKISALPGKARLATFSLLHGEFPPLFFA